MANVAEGHGAHHTIISIVVRHEATRFYTDVSTLKNLSIAGLPISNVFRQANLSCANPYQAARNNNKESCENRQNQSVEGHRIVRLPDGFVWLCLGGGVVGALLGVCYLWALGMFSGEQKRRY
jgi:hypothetical protein